MSIPRSEQQLVELVHPNPPHALQITEDRQPTEIAHWVGGKVGSHPGSFWHGSPAVVFPGNGNRFFGKQFIELGDWVIKILCPHDGTAIEVLSPEDFAAKYRVIETAASAPTTELNTNQKESLSG